MTLARKLLAGITAVFIALLIGIVAIYVISARHHLAAQLDAHANETATSLALSIGSRMQTLDEALIHTIVNTIFDRGHFASIKVQATNGNTAFERQLAQNQIALPSWFIDLVAFEPPMGQSLISSGWRQMGRVIVRVHPQYAYQQLWDTALATLSWLSLLFAIALLAVRIYLADILKPLRQIENAALAIGNRNFVSIDSTPNTRELERVTSAMNSLSFKIRDAISHETAVAERLRRDAFEDPMSGFLNRRGFENSVSATLEEGGAVATGALALFSITGLEEINQLLGLAKGNEVLKHFATSLAAPGDFPSSLVGRWQGPSFAVFIADVKPETVITWAEGTCSTIVAELRAAGLPGSVTVACGITQFAAGEAKLPELAKRADSALTQAIKKGGGVVVAQTGATTQVPLDMKSEIEAALAGDRVSILFQKVASIPRDDILQFEFFAKLTDSQRNPISAAAFIPVASQHGLLPALDRRIAELTVTALGRNKTLPPVVALNVSMQAVLDADFRATLQKLLKAHPNEAKRMVFEMTGASASKSPDITRSFAAELRRAGSQLALDNFEVDRNAIALVHELMPAYVKLAPVFTREIGQREDVRFILEAMLRVFRPLEIPVIAQGVEDKALVATLTDIGMVGYQGYVLGMPEPLID